ncbi:DUF3800 domain-containing protein [Agrobacterium tumefaciens]|uniref:3-deoxy-D-manno-octulosonic acid transferase n=1 Tax=Agrobacterium tumefaciens TaxID=358 RepID=A0A176X8Y4_AGRTU|nr:DUF3800 domain-containing protein [Agrobacterium tumefaciens]OAE43610.1 3-deoxy-D-manno-octulosonic acid transferase [Agrobacterium tumefaciens]
MGYGDFIVYIDESGDHGMANINPESPVFALTFCIFSKDSYRLEVVPSAQELKFEYWGHDCVVFHGHEIRKARGDFSILLNADVRGNFIEHMNTFIATLPVTIIAAAIDKQKHKSKYAFPKNPYEIALAFCMERLQFWLKENGQLDKTTHLLVEKRGKPEDDALELEFRRIVDGANAFGKMPNLEIRFMDKKHNSTGLQVADLVAYPIARHVIKPDQPNRAYELIEPKIRSYKGKIHGYGLKVFP